MNKLEFTCLVISPLFTAGANRKLPELRTSTIKGMMRYWWRAANGHLPDGRMLKEMEAEIFGSAETGRSKIVLELFDLDLTENEELLLPHRLNKDPDQNPSPASAFKPGSRFSLRIKLLCDKVVYSDEDQRYEIMNLETLKSLFFISTTLSGFGRRSRRGMGVIHIENYLENDSSAVSNDPFTLSSICTHLNAIAIKIKPNQKELFVVKESRIENQNGILDIPRILNIRLGPHDYLTSALSKIGTVTSELKKETKQHFEDKLNSGHSVKSSKKFDYENSIGNGGKNRLASPLVISLVEAEGGRVQIIATKLKNTKTRKLDRDQKALQNEFLNRVLN